MINKCVEERRVSSKFVQEFRVNEKANEIRRLTICIPHSAEIHLVE